MNWKTHGGWVVAGIMSLVATFFAGMHFAGRPQDPSPTRAWQSQSQKIEETPEQKLAREAAEVAELRSAGKTVISGAPFEPLKPEIAQPVKTKPESE